VAAVRTVAVRKDLTQERMLETELKIGRWTRAARKHRPQMLHGLQEWLNLRAGRRGLLPAQPGPHLIEPALQSPPQPMERFQGKGQLQCFDSRFESRAKGPLQCFDSRFEGEAGQQLQEPPPHQWSIESVPGQNVRQHY
jgi:hypothetical protein